MKAARAGHLQTVQFLIARGELVRGWAGLEHLQTPMPCVESVRPVALNLNFLWVLA